MLKEQGLAVVLCCLLLGFVLWTNYTQQKREDSRITYEQKQAANLLTVISANTSAMHANATANEGTATAIEALRMEIMKNK